jgi:hypothetical protein
MAQNISTVPPTWSQAHRFSAKLDFCDWISLQDRLPEQSVDSEEPPTT